MANWFISVTAAQEPLTSDTIATIGGDRYGWFVINEINDLAIDCSNLRPRAIGHPPLQRPCEFDDEAGDDDDFDDDDERDDEDEDDDNDGENDDDDNDDDNDGENDDADTDDDDDGIEDSFDSESQMELQQSNVDVVEGGQENAYDLAVGGNTLLLVATAEAIDDPLNESLTVEIYNPAGVLIAASPPIAGRVVATAVPVLQGTYRVKVINSGSGAIPYRTMRITRTSWPL